MDVKINVIEQKKMRKKKSQSLLAEGETVHPTKDISTTKSRMETEKMDVSKEM